MKKLKIHVSNLLTLSTINKSDNINFFINNLKKEKYNSLTFSVEKYNYDFLELNYNSSN